MSDRLRLAALLGERTARMRLGRTAPPDLQTLPPSEWLEPLLQEVESDALVRAAIHLVRSLLLPRWIEAHRDERRPVRALEAAEQCFRRPSAEAYRQALSLAKDCAEVRADAAGATHRIVLCVRAVACAAAHTDRIKRHVALIEMFEKAEEELALAAAAFDIERSDGECRAVILDVMSEVLLPEEGRTR